MTHASCYWYGNKISDYGIENGYLDYRTLAKSFDAVLNNDIMSATENAGLGYWEMQSGTVDNSEEIEELEEKRDNLEDKKNDLEDEKEDLESELEELEDDKEEAEDAEKARAILASIEDIKEELEEKEKEIEELSDEIEELEDEISELEAEEEPDEVFQWFIVDDNGAHILEEINEIVYYNEEVDMYLWGVTHWGTSWDYVLTNVKLELDEEE